MTEQAPGGIPRLSKFSTPCSPHWLRRPRLFASLDELREGTVVWLSAPAGCGKTVLAASYLAERKLPSLWYRVDVRDADPGTFFFFLREAACQLGVRGAASLTPLTAEYAGGEAVYARNFCEALFAGAPDGFVLVLDDFQELPESSPTESLLSAILESVPHGRSVFVLSRHLPPPALARLHANQQLNLMGEVQLRLTLDETRWLLDSWPQCGDKKPNAEEIHQRTQGWAAATVLTLKNVAAKNPAAVAGDVADTAIFDYLAAELLTDMAPVTRTFLLTTALVPQFDTALACVLSGSTDAPAILDSLLRHNLFLYEEEGSIYRYHPLCRQLLLRMIEREWDAERLARLRIQAADVLLARQEPDLALPLLEAASAWPQFIQALLKHAGAMMTQGRHHELDIWLRRVPESVQRSSPWVKFWRATALLPTDLAASYRLFHEAYNVFWEAQEAQGVMLAWMGAVDAIIYSLSDAARLDYWMERFEQLRTHYPQDNQELEGQLASRVMSIIILRQPDHPALSEWRHKAEQNVRRIADVNQRIISGFYLCTHSIWRGDLSEAAALIERLVSQPPASLPPLAATTYYLARAWLGWTSGERVACVDALGKGLAIAEESGVYVWYAILLMQGSTNALIQAAPDEAEIYISRLTPKIIEARDMDRAYYYIDRAWLELSRGDVLQALESQRRAIKAAEDFGAVYTRAEACFGMAQVQHALGQQESAQTYLQQARALGHQFNSWTMTLQCGLAEAQFALDAGDEARAVTVLRPLLDQVRSKGVVAYNGWRPQVIARLFALALQHDICSDLVLNLIHHHRLPPPMDAPAQSWPWPVRIWTLGRFALEVDGASIDLTGNKHRRPCDLLKLLLASQPHGISEQRLAEILWPELDGDTAMRNLRTNLHRLRRLLGNDQAVQIKQGNTVLNRQLCWTDAAELERMLSAIATIHNEDLAGLSINLLDGYAEPFLPADEQQHILGYRQKQHAHFIQGLTLLESRLRANGQAGIAQQVAERIDGLSRQGR